MKQIAILGSTGSIGTQTLEVVDQHPERYSVEILTANNNVDLLIKQAKKYKPNTVVIANEDKYNTLVDALFNEDIKVFAGSKSIEDVVEFSCVDIVVTAMVGYSGLLPTIKAIKAKKQIALANKETLVVAGDIIQELVRENNVNIFPVDSEHSAIFQSLVGEGNNEIEKILLTASGGPFRNKDINFLKTVRPQDALKHPNWDMGAKITIDSASMMNKGFEAIEAKWLFNLQPEQIEVLVHPQSIIHSGVQFRDGAVKAQLGAPDMKVPIQYALNFPERPAADFPRMNLFELQNLSFEKPDFEKFRNLQLAFDAMHKGGNMACIVNAANEIAVDAFLKEKISFLGMTDLIEKCMNQISFINKPNIQDYIETDNATREFAKTLI
ncbi:1-deoxy-D-xylulose-5-phosphate reductoisomerase [Marinilabiliaceae bacterium JC040]|nr:1-deoxy-D-xylulose-5-phosphate reductoisomerase [Marinilabiliaceae bacterium JC040]